MFAVKATYGNETRKFAFPDSVLFPAYDELCQQLCRIFPIARPCFLSNLIFSPDAPKPGRILVGKAVHSAEDYDLRVAPLRRIWPNPLLRFTIVDETSHTAQSGSERLSLYSVLPPSPVPHPPLPTTAPCCPITKGKADIQLLLSSFKEDLEGILSRTFAGHAEMPTASSSGDNPIPPHTETPVSTAAKSPSQWCFVCKTSFTGVWYGCVKCPWHAVCSSCFSKSHSAHTLSFGPSHVVQRRATDSAQVTGEMNARNTLSDVPHSPVPGAAGDPALSVHHGVICDGCNETVVGIRHKCLDCPDYDLCTACVQSGATEQHNPFHQFFDIDTPGRVYVHTVFNGDGDRSFESSSFDHAPVTQHSPDATATEVPVAHSAACNLCDSAIVGERYKCVTCPDFDTCSSCFRITAEQHPVHGFVKVNKPDDLIMRDIPLRHAAHLAVCDSCGKTIFGARYKCMHPGCPDFDLCSDCEALPIPVHPQNHPLLKLRTSDTVIPPVYRVGQTQATHPRSALVGSELGSPAPLSHSPVVTPIRSPELGPVAVSTNVPAEDQIPFAEEFLSPLGSPQGEVPVVAPTSDTVAPSPLVVDVTKSPGSSRSTHPALDVHHQSWPRVNQELMHLDVLEKNVGNLAGDYVEDAITEPVGAQESLPETHATDSFRRAPASSTPGPKSVVDGFRTPSSTPSNVQESHGPIQQPATGDQQELATSNSPCRVDSVFVGDTNVPDGQVFPPGAEFVKGWHMMNNGELPWPVTTEIQFVAGEMFSPDSSVGLRANVGVVHPGQDLDVWTGDLKAPDVPGRYVGYWRLNDGQGNFFGAGVWIDLTVADHHSDPASEQSLAASSMVMPSGNPTNPSDGPQDAPHPSLPSTRTVTDEVGGPESDISSVSLVSAPTSDEEDAEWQDTRTHSEPLEYVVLYNGISEE